MSFIAVDWGTSNCRAALLRDGECVEWIDGLPGARYVAPGDFATVASSIRQRLGDHPMLLSGMVGSTIGWMTAPYCAAPVALDTIAAHLSWMDYRTAIVPGVSQARADRPDVMRGEEVQILGAVAHANVEGLAVFCQPGTHSKWVQVDSDRILSFHTVMTGELFDLLRSHSVLGRSIAGPVEPGDAFIRGLADASDRDAIGKLFRVRAGSLLLDWPAEFSAAYASGLLIGAECASCTRSFPTPTVHLVSDDNLCPLYSAAIEFFGRKVIAITARDAFVAGMVQIAGHAFASGKSE